jgi:hypothetical protein
LIGAGRIEGGGEVVVAALGDVYGERCVDVLGLGD